MDGMKCDRHSSAWAQARVLLPSLRVLYWCAHCLRAFQRDYAGEFTVTYETVNV